MLHLLKKVYIASDRVIDVNFDRIVVSEEHGFDTLESIKADGGALIAKGFTVQDIVGEEKDFSSLTDLFDNLAKFCDNSGKKVIIYADDKNFTHIIAYWYKLIFKNIDADACRVLVNNMLVKYYMFQRARTSTFASPNENFEIDISTFDAEFSSVEIIGRESFVSTYLEDLSVEALLATYLNNGQAKEALKTSVRRLLVKDLEKYLYELKEIFLTHCLVKRFTDKLDLEKDYSWENLSQFTADKSKFGELFFSDRIWQSKYMYIPSPGRNINFENITDTDIENFKEFTQIAGSSWAEEIAYVNVKSDVNKLDFLGIISNFTDELLNNLIDTEATYENAAGTFFAIDLETVNHYFIVALLEANKTDNKQFLNTHSVL